MGHRVPQALAAMSVRLTACAAVGGHRIGTIMGNRITGLASGIDPKMVDKLVEAQKIPVETAKNRREKFVTEKGEFEKLNGFMNELDTSLNGLKLRGDFYKLKLDSSHPDIIDGVVNSGNALIGSYEFEVRGLARAEKELAYGFPDKDQTPVGFGYMEIEREDMEPFELTVEPGSTLDQVANQINQAGAGLRAMVINTKYNPDSFRLLVISEKSGQEAKINIDEDTTFLEFKEQVTGTNLDVLFEDVPVTDEDNTLDELLEGVVINLKRSEPGTRVQVSVAYDVDATLEGIKAFVEKYNQIIDYVSQQYKEDPQSGQLGALASDSAVRTVVRGLQGAFTDVAIGSGKFNILADVGIKTNSKTGMLDMDETKVRNALTEDYEGVAKLFIRTDQHPGIAERLAQKLKSFRDPSAGVMRTRIRGLETIIKNQDESIARKEDQLKAKEQNIRRQFASLENTMADLNSQSDFLKARMGGGGQG